MKALLKVTLLASTSLPYLSISAQYNTCNLNNTANQPVCQFGNYFQVGAPTSSTTGDVCNQLRNALGALTSTFGGVVDARAMVTSVGSPLTSMTCMDSQLTPGTVTPGDNPFYIDNASTPHFAPPSQLLLGAQTIALSRQWVIPSKSSIVGLSGTSGYSTGNSTNTVLVACRQGGSFAPACGASNYSFVPQLTNCSSATGTGGHHNRIHCNSPHGLAAGNFVLIEGSGTDLDDAWEVTGTPPPSTDTNEFYINYNGSTAATGLIVNIPLVWLGANAGSGGVDQGVSLEGLTVDCNDVGAQNTYGLTVGGSIGIFSATINENSFLNHVSVRNCTRNGVYYKRTQQNGTPANFGPDKDLTVLMSDSSPGHGLTSKDTVTVTSLSVTSGIATAYLSAAPMSPWLGYPITVNDGTNGTGLFTVVAEQDTSPIFIKFPFNGSTCTTCTGVSATVLPAAYRVDIGSLHGGQPWRGFSDATIRPNSVENRNMDGIQMDGVSGGTVQNIHCEILNHCLHITNAVPGYGTTIQNITVGSTAAPIYGYIFANDPNGGLNTSLMGLATPAIPTSDDSLVYDNVSSSATIKQGISLQLYISGANNVTKTVQSCGVASMSGTSANPLSMTCSFVQTGAVCVAFPTTSPAPTNVSITVTSPGHLSIAYLGTGNLAITCSNP
jgi:hypothetical protein